MACGSNGNGRTDGLDDLLGPFNLVILWFLVVLSQTDLDKGSPGLSREKLHDFEPPMKRQEILENLA